MGKPKTYVVKLRLVAHWARLIFSGNRPKAHAEMLELGYTEEEAFDILENIERLGAK